MIDPVSTSSENAAHALLQSTGGGAAFALPLALGAGTALLTAPQSGEETRAALRGRAKRIGRTTTRRGRDAWAELRDELQSATTALRRRRAKRAARRALQHELERESIAE